MAKYAILWKILWFEVELVKFQILLVIFLILYDSYWLAMNDGLIWCKMKLLYVSCGCLRKISVLCGNFSFRVPIWPCSDRLYSCMLEAESDLG